jgi:hypothetical protein
MTSTNRIRLDNIPNTDNLFDVMRDGIWQAKIRRKTYTECIEGCETGFEVVRGGIRNADVPAIFALLK